MKPFKTTAKGLAMGPGVQVRLTPAQAAPWLGKLKKIAPAAADGRATFAVVEMIKFKAGEVVEYGGEVSAPLPLSVAKSPGGKKSGSKKPSAGRSK